MAVQWAKWGQFDTTRTDSINAQVALQQEKFKREDEREAYKREQMEQAKKLEEEAREEAKHEAWRQRERQKKLDAQDHEYRMAQLEKEKGETSPISFYSNVGPKANGIDRQSLMEESPYQQSVQPQQRVRSGGRQIPNVTRAPQSDIGSFLEAERNSQVAAQVDKYNKSYEEYFAKQAEQANNRNLVLASMLHSTMAHRTADENGFIPVDQEMMKIYNAETGSNHLGMLIATKNGNKDLNGYQVLVVDYATDANGRQTINPATGQPAIKLTPVGPETLAAITAVSGQVPGMESLAKFGAVSPESIEQPKNAEKILRMELDSRKKALGEVQKKKGTIIGNTVVTGNEGWYQKELADAQNAVEETQAHLNSVLMGNGTIEADGNGGYRFVSANGNQPESVEAPKEYKSEGSQAYIDKGWQNTNPGWYAEEAYNRAQDEAEEARNRAKVEEFKKLDDEYRAIYEQNGLKYYGLREDGTPKDEGWFGELKNANGNAVTELPVTFDIDGQEVLAPLIVPTLTDDEVDFLIDTVNMGLEPTTDEELKKFNAIHKKAETFASERLKKGLSPFYNKGEAEQQFNDAKAEWDKTVELHKGAKDDHERNLIAGKLDQMKSGFESGTLDKDTADKRRYAYNRRHKKNVAPAEKKPVEKPQEKPKASLSTQNREMLLEREKTRNAKYENYKKIEKRYNALKDEWDKYRKDQLKRSFTMDSKSDILDRKIAFEEAQLEAFVALQDLEDFDAETERIANGSDEMPKTPDGIKEAFVSRNELDHLQYQQRKRIEELKHEQEMRKKKRPILGNPGAGEHMDFIDSW